MEININITIDDKIVNAWKRGKKKLPKLLVWLGLIPIALHATPVTIPNTFSAGTAISASQMNANFTAVKTAVDDNDARITTLENSKFIRSANGTTVYALNDQLSPSNYVLTHAYKFNYGNSITVNRTATGIYSVTFAALDCNKGMFVVSATALGGIFPENPEYCKVQNWSVSGTDCNVSVSCYLPSNTIPGYVAADSGFGIMYID